MSDTYCDADLLDAFAMQIPPGAGNDVRALGHAVLGRQPLWFKPLLSMRDGVVRRLGIQTSATIRASDDGRERIDFFPIISIHEVRCARPSGHGLSLRPGWPIAPAR